MATALGLLAFVLFIAVVIGVAAAVTMLVVKLSPPKKPEKTEA
jgi:hypothetical protein